MDEYIERKAAYEDFEKCNSENPKWTPSRVKALIARQKAADVAPVRYGRWKVIGQVCIDGEYEDTLRCTNCGMKHDRKSRYCENCGARMDGDG